MQNHSNDWFVRHARVILHHRASKGILDKEVVGNIALLTQNAKEGFRPYMHPVKDAKGKGNLTQFSPGHHKHQTGLYWGMTRVNGRDYFHNPSSDHWKRKAVNVIQEKGESVKWQTIYDMLDKDGKSQMTETQSWTMSMTKNKEIILDLEWNGMHKLSTVSLSAKCITW